MGDSLVKPTISHDWVSVQSDSTHGSRLRISFVSFPHRIWEGRNYLVLFSFLMYGLWSFLRSFLRTSSAFHAHGGSIRQRTGCCTAGTRRDGLTRLLPHQWRDFRQLSKKPQDFSRRLNKILFRGPFQGAIEAALASRRVLYSRLTYISAQARMIGGCLWSVFLFPPPFWL